MDKNTVKNAIKEYEYYMTGAYFLEGYTIKIKNLREIDCLYVANVYLYDENKVIVEKWIDSSYKKSFIDGLIEELYTLQEKEGGARSQEK